MAREATERDRYWLAHQEAAAASGKPAKEYAADQGLSIHAFYQARKRLRALGLLARPGAAAPKKKPRRRASSFAKVEVLAPGPTGPVGVVRIRLPNGLVVECAGGEPLPSVAELVERLAQIR